MKAFLLRELQQLFFRPLLYLSALLFTLILGLFLWFFDNSWNIFAGENAGLAKFFLLAPQLLIVFSSALAVRSFAFEKENKTMGWIFTQPVQLRVVVWSKFLALFVAIVFMLLPTLVYVWCISALKLEVQQLDYPTLWISYLGMVFCSMAYAALGILSSAIANNQIQSFLISLLLCFLFYFAWEGIASFNLLGSADFWIKKLGIQAHYRSFAKGVLDLSDLMYFAALVIFVLWLSTQLLNKQKQHS